MKRCSPIRNNPKHKEFMTQYYYTKSSANVRNLDFKLTKEEVKILHKQKCVYCNRNPNQGNKYKFNGIDRLDNNKGYIKINCVTCCRKCNRSKNSISYKIAKKFVKLYEERFKRK